MRVHERSRIPRVGGSMIRPIHGAHPSLRSGPAALFAFAPGECSPSLATARIANDALHFPNARRQKNRCFSCPTSVKRQWAGNVAWLFYSAVR
jgi:hypothetical protein